MTKDPLSLANLMRSRERFFILICLILGLLVIVAILNRFVANFRK